MIRLLLDQGLPRTAAAILSDAGIDAMHVADLGMSEASDEEIVETARKRSATVVTFDADFHSLLAATGAKSPSVIRLRMQGLKGPASASLLQNVLSVCSVELSAGAAVTVTHAGVRIRMLPLV